MSKQEPNAIYNLHFLLTLQLAAEMAAEIQADADAARWEDEAARLQIRHPHRLLGWQPLVG